MMQSVKCNMLFRSNDTTIIIIMCFALAHSMPPLPMVVYSCAYILRSKLRVLYIFSWQPNGQIRSFVLCTCRVRTNKCVLCTASKVSNKVNFFGRRMGISSNWFDYINVRGRAQRIVNERPFGSLYCCIIVKSRLRMHKFSYVRLSCSTDG